MRLLFNYEFHLLLNFIFVSHFLSPSKKLNIPS